MGDEAATTSRALPPTVLTVYVVCGGCVCGGEVTHFCDLETKVGMGKAVWRLNECGVWRGAVAVRRGPTMAAPAATWLTHGSGNDWGE